VEDEIRIVPEGLRGKHSNAALCRRECIAGDNPPVLCLCRKRSPAALLPACTGIVVSPTKLWGFEPALWSTILTTRRIACIGGWRS
jgi:hypothetical protein